MMISLNQRGGHTPLDTPTCFAMVDLLVVATVSLCVGGGVVGGLGVGLERRGRLLLPSFALVPSLHRLKQAEDVAERLRERGREGDS